MSHGMNTPLSGTG